MTAPEVRSVQELQSLIEKGARPKFQFFWGHRPKTPQRVDQSCLSNWFPSRFTVQGVEYPTMEHFMMAEKARLFNDQEVLSQILIAKSPGAAKSLGRKVANFREEQWLESRLNIVSEGCLAKFSQNKEMAEFLRITGSKVLVEASPVDRIWGIGMDSNDPRSSNPLQWKGLNLLGFALMEARGSLPSPQ